ncbi:hypothetical protein RND71_038672 [Anisodus tanguticus]|uniref:DUF7910 domain-containing protein n=1 Tax=Anisodus tanguticus TaxID=243964 RepID=A0AAE1R0T0_9SOLA|nr:hypothetical protein RND71_038672 [Anisodus tanguticus]
MKVFNKQFVGTSNEGSNAVAVATTPGDTETFQIIRNPDDLSKVRLKASNGQFLQAKSGSSVTIDYQGSADWKYNIKVIIDLHAVPGSIVELEMDPQSGEIPRSKKQLKS